MTKQELVNQISETAQLNKSYKLAKGSSIPSQFFVDLERKFGIPHSRGMESRAAAFCDFYDVEWDAACDSSLSASGGGGTVTRHGLEVLLSAVARAMERE
jgi:hypothetical protein